MSNVEGAQAIAYKFVLLYRWKSAVYFEVKNSTSGL